MTTYPLRVIARRQETLDAVSLCLEVPANVRSKFAYRPGQFVVVRALIDEATLLRHYSISSAPELDQHLRITVKKVPQGIVSSWLVTGVMVDDILEVTSPRGHFYERPEGLHHLVLLAAGSGIAPVISIARHVLGRRAGHRVSVVYGNRSEDTMILKTELDDLVHRYPTNCVVDYVLSRPSTGWPGARGRIDQYYLQEHYDNWRTRCSLPMTFYLCGPAAFMQGAEAFLIDRQVALEDIRHESFDLLVEDDSSEPDLIVGGRQGEPSQGPVVKLVATVAGGEVVVSPRADETVLAALLRAGVDAPHSCQQGSCSSCLCRVTQGAVRVRPKVLKTLRSLDLDSGLTLACISTPVAPTVGVDFDSL